MTPLQEKLLDIFCVFDEFCRKYQISYFMLGGTMLGAYRHQGFIPWDDDVDLGMPREDYKRFLKLANDKLPKYYILRHRSIEKDVPFAFAHLEDNRTTCIEARRNRESYVGGVYIEIFPLDGCSKYYFLQKYQAFLVYVKKKLLYAKIMDYHEKHRVFYKAILIKIIRKFSTIEKRTKKLEKCIVKYNYNKSLYACNHLGHWGICENIPKRYIEPSKEYKFEGHFFCGVQNPEQYLTFLYGKDFMILPTEKEQEKAKHPAFYLNLELPFEKYKQISKK